MLQYKLGKVSFPLRDRRVSCMHYPACGWLLSWLWTVELKLRIPMIVQSKVLYQAELDSEIDNCVHMVATNGMTWVVQAMLIDDQSGFIGRHQKQLLHTCGWEE